MTEAQHMQTIRNAQMEAVTRWPEADQIALVRMILAGFSDDGYTTHGARVAAQCAADAVDEMDDALRPVCNVRWVLVDHRPTGGSYMEQAL